jgi:exodeoxyribonuclease VII large subunit
MQAVDYLQCRVVHPEQQLQRQKLHLDQLQQRMQRSFTHARQQQSWQCQSYTQRLRNVGSDFARLLDKQSHLTTRLVKAGHTAQLMHQARLDAAMQHLGMLNPDQVLARGYSLVQDKQGHLVSDASHLASGDGLRIRFAKGWAQVAVEAAGDTQ